MLINVRDKPAMLLIMAKLTAILKPECANSSVLLLLMENEFKWMMILR